ncbi:flagellar biosynthetic protein FliO [Microbacterium sp. 77mftsu3.1]|uniref:flagellar biosynthetic protein FliO n=1 Tax=Microbacterium sp. 77mftsu3.1 TaxID=1761802 RepID=UPI000364F82C|nr:flagellar biosynthetic protein FliO [Microbacterium sp. 77mftsu3.1]SDH36150.1 Flagellar biosynthesis protein, FliO [Microbacterium sp. 77mftsu3.1]
MFGILWFLHRRITKSTAQRATEEPITVIARKGIGPKAQLVVVESAAARYVLGVAENGITVVDRLAVSAPTEPFPIELDAVAHSWDMNTALTAPAPAADADFSQALAVAAESPAPQHSMLSLGTWVAAARRALTGKP